MEQRETRQRRAIREAFDSAGRPLSPKEVLDIASTKVPNLGIATVYRNIRTLVDQEELAVVEIPGQSPRYSRANGSKTPLLFCTRTNRLFHLEPEGVQVAIPRLPENFQMQDYDLIVYGEFQNGTERV